MNRLCTAVLATVVLLSLVACSDSEGEQAEGTGWAAELPTGPPEPEVGLYDDAPFGQYDDLLADTDAFDHLSRDTVDAVATAACEALDTQSVDDVILVAIKRFDAGDVGSLLLYAAWSSCPRHKLKLLEWSEL